MTDSSDDWLTLTLEEVDADNEAGKEYARQKLREFCTECGLNPTDAEIEEKLAPIFRQHDENQAPLRARLQRQHGHRMAVVRGGRHDRR